jgi:MEDS: MEthanogen/methylotroph, DcmR Sensory domain
MTPILDCPRHICAFFHNRDEEYRWLVDFVRDGIEPGDRFFHVVDPNYRVRHRERLIEGGINVEALEEKGQLEILEWDSFYLIDGAFDEKKMLVMIDGVLTDGRKRGFPRTRFYGSMPWTVENRLSVEDFICYEARVNDVISKHQDPVACGYDLTRFDGSTIVDAMRTHPTLVIGDVIQQNPFYIEPEEMIAEVRGRAGATR